MTDAPSKAKPPRPPLRIFAPMIAVGCAFALYSVFWYVVAGQVRTAIETFAANPNQGDVNVGWGDLSISGYPYRVAATFDAPVAAAPLAPEDWSWRAGSIEADFLPYNLRHVVLKIGGEQVLRYRDVSGATPARHTIRSTAEGTWASYVALSGTPIGRLAVDIDGFAARIDGDKKQASHRFTAGRLQLHMRPSEDLPTSSEAPILASLAGNYDLALQGDDMAMDTADALPALGPKIALIAVQARLKNVPKSRHASLVELARDWLQDGGKLEVSDLNVKWGPLDLWAEGALTLDAKARPQGNFDAEIADYPGLLDALVKANVVKAREAQLALVGLGLVAELQGNADGRVRVPVAMNEGKLYLGPLFIATLDPVY